MVRIQRMLIGAALVALASTAGCRSPRTEVPPGRFSSQDGRPAPHVGFSADPSNVPAGGYPGLNPDGSPAGGASAMSNYGAPTPNTYGPPGTAGITGGTDYPPAYGPTPAPAAVSPGTSIQGEPLSAPNLAPGAGGGPGPL